MNNINRTINNLKKIIQDSNCRKMNMSNVKGYLGELYVYKKLTEEGLELIQRGNQSGHDLEFNEIKIDVKLSTLKLEVKGIPKSWSWALKTGRKEKPITCTHFVCVALDDKLDPINYYVIKSKNLKYFDRFFNQFNNVTNGFALLPSKTMIHSLNKEHRKFFQKCYKLLEKGFVIKVSPKHKLLTKLQKKA